MDQVWRDAPVGALRVTAGAGGWCLEPNVVARVWGDARQWAEPEWQALAQSQMALPVGEHLHTQGEPPVAVRCRHVPLPDGRLLWLMPAQPDDPMAGDRIALLQAFGRIGLYVRDLVGGGGRWDRHMFELTGLDPARGTPAWSRFLSDCVHPDDREALDAHYRAVQAAPRRGEVHFRVCLPDGSVRRVHSLFDVHRSHADRPACLVGVVIDDSAAGHRLAGIERSRQFLQRALERSGVSVWRVDLAAQRVHFNAIGYRIVNMRPDPQGIPLHVLRQSVHPEDLPAIEQAAEQALACDDVVDAVARYKQEDGSWRTLLTRRIAERDESGQPVGLMGFSIDLSERQRQDEVRREAEQAARASREKSAFMALMSHRLRTPLNAVLGFAALMANDSTDPLRSRQRERLSRIDSAGHDLLAMVDDVFELAALGDETVPPARVPVALGSVMDQVAQSISPLARQRQVRLSVLGPGHATDIATDRRLLGQALGHLVAHAVRRNDAGGWVELSVTPDDATEGEPGPWCQLVLRDGGPQLTPRQRELLFDTPVPAPPEVSSSGDALVGLDLVRQALTRLGAQIDWLHPQATDSGLLIRLPTVAPASGEATEGRDPDALRLLCIEDNAVNLLLVRELVAMRPGIVLSCATDGESGLALAAAERPDAVLLDLHLPDISGLEVLSRLRTDPRHAGCTVIALSANAVPEDIRAARARGFDDYWTKPIDFDRFLAGLDGLARGRVRAPGAP